MDAEPIAPGGLLEQLVERVRRCWGDCRMFDDDSTSLGVPKVGTGVFAHLSEEIGVVEERYFHRARALERLRAADKSVFSAHPSRRQWSMGLNIEDDSAMLSARLVNCLEKFRRGRSIFGNDRPTR